MRLEITLYLNCVVPGKVLFECAATSRHVQYTLFKPKLTVSEKSGN